MRELCICLVVAACSQEPATKETKVGPEGGTLRLDDGTSLVVPAGALASPTQITIERVAAPTPPDGTDPVSDAYVFGPEGLMFSAPVTITLAVDPGKIPAGRGLGEALMITAPKGTTAFTALTTSVADTTHISAQVRHFSVFVGVISKEPGVELGIPVEDMSAGADLAGTNNGDMSVPLPDLVTANSDLACGILFSGNLATCYLNAAKASCGHDYQLTCSSGDMAIWDCICSTDGSTTKMFYAYATSSCSESTLRAAWTAQCGYP